MSKILLLTITMVCAMLILSIVYIGLYYLQSFATGMTWLNILVVAGWLTICYGATLGILILIHKRSQRINNEGVGNGL